MVVFTVTIDLCSPNPCENGECMDDGLLLYVCTCDPGWTGTNCNGECLLPFRSDEGGVLGVGIIC